MLGVDLALVSKIPVQLRVKWLGGAWFKSEGFVFSMVEVIEYSCSICRCDIRKKGGVEV